MEVTNILPQKTPIIEECVGCNKVENNLCKIFPFPDKKWKVSKCPMASHIIKEVVKEKVRVGQQKQKKR